MITEDERDRIRGWFAGRLPEDWRERPPDISIDREEIWVRLDLGDLPAEDDQASDAERDEARVGRAQAFREDTRQQRMKIAREAERRFERKVAWGVRIGEHEQMWTHLAAPVMTRLRQPQRLTLDTLVDAGVARSRSEALAWCVRLVGQHEEDWLAQLRDAMDAVADVRDRGPAA